MIDIGRAALVGIGIAIIGISIVIFISLASSNGSGIDCKETSSTTGEYRACIAFERCRTEFKGNPELSGSCIADIFLGR